MIFTAVSRAVDETCGTTSPKRFIANYENVQFDGLQSTISLLPGFTRSVYKRNYALVTPESRVWASMVGWSQTLTSHFISPAAGAHFSFFLADMKPGAVAPAPAQGVERFVLIVNGSIKVDGVKGWLTTNHYAYFPPGSSSFKSTEGAGILVIERKYSLKGQPQFQYGYVEDSPELATPGEVFVLRKLLPATQDYDFNIHVMDFQAGEYLNVKEVHYNQHGLLMLQGQGIYRLGEDWYPVQAGDIIWMAPYVPQWYAALAPGPSRYVLYKDTILDPLETDVST